MEAPLSLILVVDDDARSARTLANMLREDGYEVDAVDSACAIQRLSRHPMPSVLITDIRMPSADGTTVPHFARSKNPDLPIIMVTGYPQLAPHGLEPRPIVITKPLQYDDLSAALARVGVRSA